ncbi:hypothetical protein RFI_01979, partial [Reticulomyxa filosa]
GHGTESSSWYANAKILFLDIDNIHTMRKSFDELCQIAANTTVDDTDWLSIVAKTSWSSHVQKVLCGASLIAKRVANTVNILFYFLLAFIDGWDRTSQLASLAQILLDPFCRTIRGLIMLIEKDWLAFGHKFMDRNGTTQRPNERSPIFFQFVECVWQIVQQFPEEFEFDESFLIRLADHHGSYWFGNFLYNSEKERVDNEVHNRCISLWSWPIERSTRYNPDPEKKVCVCFKKKKNY